MDLCFYQLLRDAMSEVIVKHGHVFCEQLNAAAENGSAVDMHDRFFRFTMVWKAQE